MTNPANTPQLDSEELRGRLLDLVPCIDWHCDKHGTTVEGDMDNPEPAQCQYCYQDRFPAVDQIIALIQADRAAFANRVLAVVPDIQNHPSLSDPDIHEVAQAHYDQGWNDLRFLVTTAITNLVAEERGEK